MKQLCRKTCALLMLTSLLWTQGALAGASPAVQISNPAGRRPNILFIIMDDVGIDQLRVFGYGGLDAPNTPNLDAIAHAGVRFRNVWAMPECSPSRAIFFEGRFPLRTNVMAALLDDDLANSQVSPFEVTTPKLLHKRNYDSGNFGKFHLDQVQNNPFGIHIIQSLGWDYSDGFLDGAPHPIDTTAGGASPGGIYSCGFVPGALAGGADSGSCRFADNTCKEVAAVAPQPPPGRTCMEQGGIFVPNTTCRQTPPNPLTFDQANGYYVWPRVIGDPDGRAQEIPLHDARSRGYIGEATLNSAVDWITQEDRANKPWMATVAFAQIHTPYQQIPASLVPSGAADLSALPCTPNNGNGLAIYHLLSNQMMEAMDNEIGRLLVRSGLATFNSDGTLNYQPEKTNTMVVMIGDNGTYAAGVKLPFDFNRSKGTVYQTGVWVPLIVAGPLVNSPDRDVESMVSIADLFQLWGEIAGIDVHKEVPKSHILDSQSMLGYLTNPNQASIRKTNFTQTGNNIHPAPPPPCVIAVTSPATCVQLLTHQALCEYEGGDWYGPPASDPTAPPVYTSCCAVQKAIESGQLTQYGSTITILPDFQTAVRDDTFKLVQKGLPNCSAQPNSAGVYPDATLTEFYQIDESAPVPKLDKDGTALCADNLDAVNCPSGLSPDQLVSFNRLGAEMSKIVNSEPACPGDGNEDKLVNAEDVALWSIFAGLGGSSWFDFNFDGKTDKTDLAIIKAHLGTTCLPKN